MMGRLEEQRWKEKVEIQKLEDERRRKQEEESWEGEETERKNTVEEERKILRSLSNLASSTDIVKQT